MPGGLLKAEIRPGVGDSRPSEGDQVSCLSIFSSLVLLLYRSIFRINVNGFVVDKMIDNCVTFY